MFGTSYNPFDYNHHTMTMFGTESVDRAVQYGKRSRPTAAPGTRLLVSFSRCEYRVWRNKSLTSQSVWRHYSLVLVGTAAYNPFDYNHHTMSMFGIESVDRAVQYGKCGRPPRHQERDWQFHFRSVDAVCGEINRSRRKVFGAIIHLFWPALQKMRTQTCHMRIF